MASIKHSDLAPDEVVHYDLAGVEFVLGGSGKASFETDSRPVLASAEIHPWLTVEYPKVDLIAGQPRRTLADHPELDAFSGLGPNANVPYDPEEIKKVEDAKVGPDNHPLAIDANLDQGQAVTVKGGDGGEESPVEVDVTLAADEDHEKAKSAKAFDQSDEVAAAAASGEGMPEPKAKTSKKGDN